MTKHELKNELKNRISMALKDPTLQQGFEIICKENAEAKKLLTKWVDLFNPKHKSALPIPIQIATEQFLKEF